MTSEDLYFIKVPAVCVEQPLGPLYVTRLSARQLLPITYVNVLSHAGPSGETYDLAGGQRPEQIQRRREIAGFIGTREAAFPNTIILGANYDKDGNLITDESRRWKITKSADGCDLLIIPKKEPLAAVIDGQHRLMAFEEVDETLLDIQLPCSIYLDLPVPYQAYVFAVINFNQKKVDKSLAYEMLAFDANSRSPDTWAPETLAVHLCRKLNVDSESPLHKHIKLAPQTEHTQSAAKESWSVSTATVVEGILSLITSNSKEDKSQMHRIAAHKGRHRSAVEHRADSSPLRSLFLDVNDKAIYTAVTNYFSVVQRELWHTAVNFDASYLRKTVGVQALFDVLRVCLEDFKTEKDISQVKFAAIVKPASRIDFSDQFFQASGLGRTRIKKCILVAGGLMSRDKLHDSDLKQYERLCQTD